MNPVPEEASANTALNAAVYLLLQGFAEVTAAGWTIQRLEVVTGSEITGHFVLRVGEADSVAKLAVTKSFVYSEPTEAELQSLSEVL